LNERENQYQKSRTQKKTQGSKNLKTREATSI